MAKNNNVIEESQGLIQQIKNEYQEGVDFEFIIHTIILDGDNLIIKHNGGKEENVEVNNPQLQLIKEIATQQKGHSLAFSDLQPTTSPSQTNPNNHHQLVTSLAIGAGAVILGGVIVYFVRKRNKK